MDKKINNELDDLLESIFIDTVKQYYTVSIKKDIIKLFCFKSMLKKEICDIRLKYNFDDVIIRDSKYQIVYL